VGLTNPHRKNFLSLRNVSKLLGPVYDEIRSTLNSGNACYYSVQNVLSSRLISKNLEIKIYKTVISPVLLYGYETRFLTFRGENRLRVLRTEC
jgi:hypothetical protein